MNAINSAEETCKNEDPCFADEEVSLLGMYLAAVLTLMVLLQVLIIS